MGKLRPFVRKDSYMPNKKWIPFVIGNGYTTTDGASGPAPEYETVTGNPVSFNAITPFPLKQLQIAFSPVQSGSGDPSPDNVRPISGWDSVNVWHTGVNVADNSTIYQGAIGGNTGVITESTTRICTQNFIPVKAGTYTIRTVPELANVVRVYGAANEKSFIPSEGDGATWNANGRTITFTADRYIRIMFSYNMGAQTPITPSELKYLNVSPSSTSISLSFGSTLYSGTLDVLTGVVTVDKTLRVFDGSVDESWGVNASGGLYAFNIPNLAENKVSRAPLCNMFKGKSPTAYKNLANGECASTSSPHNYINFKTDLCSTVEAWRTYLSEHNIQILQFVATPQTIQLTPQEVSSLLGDNIMWSDANGNLTVTYAADPATTPIVGKGKVGQAIIGG